MIDIGNTLRSARLRRDLDLHDCERETRIRARYLGALEDERFDILPEPAYARGFLRSYATFLGLDGRVLLEEFDDRFGAARETVNIAPPPERPMRSRRMPIAGAPARRRTLRRTGRLVWVAMGAVGAAVLALWVGAAWHTAPAPLPTTGATGRTAAGGAGTTVTDVRLTGSPGAGSRVTVRVADAHGRVVYDGVIAAGASRQFPLTHPLWISVGAATGVALEVAGRPAEIPGGVTAVTVKPDGTVLGA